MKILAIALTELRRFLADRSNIFFVLIFPMIMVLSVGLAFGGSGSSGTVAVAGEDSQLRTAVVERLEEADLDVTITDAERMREDVAAERAQIGVVIPDDAATAYTDGQEWGLEMISGNGPQAPVVAQLVREAAGTVERARLQTSALVEAGADPQEATEALTSAADRVGDLEVRTRETGDLSETFSGLDRFDLGGSSQTLLFIFLTGLSGAVPFIEARENGVIRRTVAAPIRAWQVIGGQALARWVIALFQGVYLVAGTTLIFGVRWGDPLAVAAILGLFSLVAAGCAMIIGVLVDHAGLASGIAVGGGLVLGALGGLMLPLELFGDGMRRVAMFTPHAWAYEAFATVQRQGGGVADILPELGVLAAVAAVVVVIGGLGLRRSLERAL